MNWNRIKILLPAFIAAVVAIGADDAAAQFSNRGMRGGRSMGGGYGQREQAPPVQRNVQDEAEDRLNMLQEDLRLRADQESAWASYADRVRAIAADVMRDRNRLQEKTDVLRQLEHIVDTARNRLTALEDVSAAAKNLYGTLTPQQQAVADPRLATVVGLLVGAAPVSIDGRAAGSYRDRADRPNKQ